jgi:hypothetical protein
MPIIMGVFSRRSRGRNDASLRPARRNSRETLKLGASKAFVIDEPDTLKFGSELGDTENHFVRHPTTI